MFIEFIHTFLETLTNTQIADIFSAPMAVFLCLMLLFLLFTMFASPSTKRLALVSVFIITVVLCIFFMAKELGFITIPITFGGST